MSNSSNVVSLKNKPLSQIPNKMALKDTKEFLAMQKKAQNISDECIAMLQNIMKRSPKDGDRLKAIDLLMNRAWGKDPAEHTIHIDDKKEIKVQEMNKNDRDALRTILLNMGKHQDQG